jgi:hypothetical protein
VPRPAGSGGGGEREPAPRAPESLGFGGEELEAPAAEEPQPTPPPEEPAPPADEPEGPAVTGVVVHVNPAAGSYTLAEATGALDVVHAAKLPRAATKLTAPVKPVADGTFAESGARTRIGARKQAKIEGTVTYVDPTAAAPAYTVSRRGVSLFVHVRPDPAGAAAELPLLGALVRVAVEIEGPQTSSPPEATEPSAEVPAAPTETGPTQSPPGCAPDPAQPTEPPSRPRAVLWQRQLSLTGEPSTFGEFAGVISAVCPEAGQLLLSADDIGESGADLAFGLASESEVDLTVARVGEAVLATAEIGTDGSLALTGLEPAFSQAVHSRFTTP